MPKFLHAEAAERSDVLVYSCCIYPACVALISLPIMCGVLGVIGIGVWGVVKVGYAYLLLQTMSMLLICSLCENKRKRPVSGSEAMLRCSLWGVCVPALLMGGIIIPLFIIILLASMPAYIASYVAYVCYCRRKNGFESKIHS